MKASRTKGDRFIATTSTLIDRTSIDLDINEAKENKYRQLLLLSNEQTNSNRTLQYSTKVQKSCLVRTSMLEDLNSLYSRIPQQTHLKMRQICSNPDKILDAPDILDDFYLNILDWGKNNQLAIGLSNNLYIWNPLNGFQDYKSISLISTYLLIILQSLIFNLIKTKGHIEQLLGTEDSSLITAVNWVSNDILSVGFDNGSIELIDANTKQPIKKLSYHMQRVNSISNTCDMMSSGGRDYSIINHDPREKNSNIISIFDKHTQEVCGLKWNNQTLASGANDNLVLLWDKKKMNVRSTCHGHTAAVKAMAWCPWQSNGLATGGGSNDRTIRFWNTDTGQQIKVIEAGSQVCALQFLQKQKEMISSHGFSKFEIALWKADNLQKTPIKMQELQGHQSRVLHLGLSPDETILCSAAGDETLRFWRVGSDSHQEESPKKGSIANLKRIHPR